MRGWLLLTFNFCLLTSPLYALEVKPVISAQLMGGQYYYQGSDSALGAIAAVSAAPYLKFNEQWSLVPLYMGSYRGTKQVTDVVGGGTLFQDSQDHVLSLKGIRAFENGLKLKASSSYAFELLRETKDEDWGDGLYDNRRLQGGTEAEWSWAENHLLRASYDFYKITFPNYVSLESQGQSLDLARELNEPNVLDTTNHAFGLSAQTAIPGSGLGTLSYGLTWRDFSEQHIVDAAGQLTGALRDDRIHTMRADGTWPLANGAAWKVLGTLGVSRTRLYSNQNNYDAGKTTFNPNYYANLKHQLDGRADLYVGENPWTVSLTWAVSRQSYADRPVQDRAGTYQNDDIRVDQLLTGLSFTYPIAHGFRLAASMNLGWSDSNMQYEELYAYHYNTASYLMGFTYAY